MVSAGARPHRANRKQPNKSRMETFVIELGNNTELDVAFEYDPGVDGSYDEPPSNPIITIMSVFLCQHDGERENMIQLHAIDDTLFPVDYGMIENMIQKHIEQ